MDRDANSFGARLRWWRERRGLSQLALAATAETTQRHLSFLESGRTAPSRTMVHRLADALALPLRQQNALLLAAGFAPAWKQRDLAAPEMAQVNRALQFMLDQQEPYPAFVVDRRWNLLRANAGAERLVEFLLGPSPPPVPGAPPPNLAEALLAPNALRPFIRNWEDTARFFLRGVHADAAADGTPETAELLARLLAFPGLPALYETLPPEEAKAPVLAMDFAKGDTSFSLFTTIATLGTPLDVTVQEIRVECFFPADEASAALFRRWAGKAPAPHA